MEDVFVNVTPWFQVEGVEKEEQRKLLRILWANSIQLCAASEFGVNSKELGLIGELIRAATYAKTQVEGSGLYPKIARINHSCAPNSIWTWVARDRSRRRKEVRSGFSASSAWKN